MTCPSKNQAVELFLNKFFHNYDMFQHAFVVAKCAEIIADKCGLDTNKAFALGLLHDYGYADKRFYQPDFHGRVGYNEMQELGYDDVAKICLTHSFPYKDMTTNNYCQEWIDWSTNKLKSIDYNDYDMLIQLCDMLVVTGKDVCTFEQRIEDITSRHIMPQKSKDNMFNNCSRLKQHFDAKCGCDIYDLLEIDR